MESSQQQTRQQQFIFPLELLDDRKKMSENCLVCQDQVTDPATAVSMQYFTWGTYTSTYTIHKWCFFCTKCFLPLNLQNAVISDNKELLCLEDLIGKVLPDCTYCGLNCSDETKVEENGFHFHPECLGKMMQTPYQATASVLEHEADGGLQAEFVGSPNHDAALSDLQAVFESAGYDATSSPEEISIQEQDERVTQLKTSLQEEFEPQTIINNGEEPISEVKQYEENYHAEQKNLYHEFKQEKNQMYSELHTFPNDFCQSYPVQNKTYQQQNQYEILQQRTLNGVQLQQNQGEVFHQRNDIFQQQKYKNRELYRLVQTDRTGVFQLAKIDPNDPHPQTIQNQMAKWEPKVEQVFNSNGGQCDVAPMKRRRTESPDTCQLQEIQFRTSPKQPKSMSTSSENSILSTSSSGRRNHRMSISVDQKSILQEMFNINQFPNRIARIDLGQKVGLDQRQVQIWFQNMRSKAKKFGVAKRKKEKVDPSH